MHGGSCWQTHRAARLDRPRRGSGPSPFHPQQGADPGQGGPLRGPGPVASRSSRTPGPGRAVRTGGPRPGWESTRRRHRAGGLHSGVAASAVGGGGRECSESPCYRTPQGSIAGPRSSTGPGPAGSHRSRLRPANGNAPKAPTPPGTHRRRDPGLVPVGTPGSGHTTEGLRVTGRSHRPRPLRPASAFACARLAPQGTARGAGSRHRARRRRFRSTGGQPAAGPDGRPGRPSTSPPPPGRGRRSDSGAGGRRVPCSPRRSRGP